MVSLYSLAWLRFHILKECASFTLFFPSEIDHVHAGRQELRLQQPIFYSKKLYDTMTSRTESRKIKKRRARYLQALRDFTAADACFSDGANPLSFHIGEIFKFLSRRDNYWVNVERTIFKNNPLLKTKDCPTVERGIVPVDYVIEMDNTKQNGRMTSAKSEDCLLVSACDESQDFFTVGFQFVL